MSKGALRQNHLTGCVLAIAGMSSACEPELVVGKRLDTVEQPACSPPDSGGAGAPAIVDLVVEVPWSTGYEDDFCAYTQAGGFCTRDVGATSETVEDPVHSGARAAAFTVDSTVPPQGTQARCFLQGQLPVDAVYGAWFYVPSLATNTGNWNLFHFQGGTPPNLPGLWDVSLGNAMDGSLFLYLFDFLGSGVRTPENPPEVPIGAWFHVEFRLRRATDATGEVELYQDGVLVMGLTGIVTDNTSFGQWYVGNLADALTPTTSTIYVDDVTIRAP